LPGPRAMSSPHNTRIRGSNRGARAGLVFMLATDRLIGLRTRHTLS
jgi:hypothetical protein